MQSSRTTLGIAMLSLNAGSFLESAVKSVLQSDYPYLTLVVQDGGSTDGSTAFLENLKDARVVYVQERDRGPADALNRAISRLSSCDIIGVINGDDLLLQGAVEHVLKKFNGDGSIEVLQGAGIYINQFGETIGTFRPELYTHLTARLRAVAIFQPSIFFRSEILLTTPFNADNGSCWDAELLYTLATQGVKFHRTNARLSAFRLHPASISGSGRLRGEYRAEENRFLGDVSFCSRIARLALRPIIRMERLLYLSINK